jgi:hypothetical protein
MNAAPHSSLAILRRIKAAARVELQSLIKANGGKVTSNQSRNAIRVEIAATIQNHPLT